MSGAILGFYFQRLQGDTSYSIQIEVDGQTHKYPAADRAVAYAAGNKNDNTGVLPLPFLDGQLGEAKSKSLLIHLSICVDCKSA